MTHTLLSSTSLQPQPPPHSANLPEGMSLTVLAVKVSAPLIVHYLGREMALQDALKAVFSRCVCARAFGGWAAIAVYYSLPVQQFKMCIPACLHYCPRCRGPAEPPAAVSSAAPAGALSSAAKPAAPADAPAAPLGTVNHADEPNPDAAPAAGVDAGNPADAPAAAANNPTQPPGAALAAAGVAAANNPPPPPPPPNPNPPPALIATAGQGSFFIVVRDQGDRELRCRVRPSTRIAAVHEAVGRWQGCDAIKLLFQGDFLLDDETLSDYGIRGGSVVDAFHPQIGD
jgi:hypothetical protein